MHLLFIALTLFTFILSISAAAPKAITIYSWPLSASAPKPWAEVAFTLNNGEITAGLASIPSSITTSDELVRIGLYDPTTKAWIGTATTASAFGLKVDRTLQVTLDTQGNVYSVGFTAESIPDPAKIKITVKKSDKKGRAAAKEAKKSPWRDGVTKVEVVQSKRAQGPVLNKPVLLDPETGKIEGSGQPEKTFLQKYWWAIAIFILVNLLATGGGDDGK